MVAIAVAASTAAFTQADAPKSHGTVRFNPAPAVIGLSLGIPKLVVDWTPCVSENLGIPAEFDVAMFNGRLFGGALSGVEEVVAGNKEKNGLYLSGLAGVYAIAGDLVLAAKADIGYQLVTNSGFVFVPAVGFKYNGVTGAGFDLKLDVGFTYR